jgi:primary-amine oxidase
MTYLLQLQVDFNLFFDSEPLNQTDLVVWANVGTHHFPRAEDAPFTPLTEARAGLLLSPFNFLDSDLSAEFSNSVSVGLSVVLYDWP